MTFTMIVAGDCSHVSDGEWGLSFVNNLETSSNGFKPFPVLEGMTSKHLLEIIVGDALNGFGVGIHD